MFAIFFRKIYRGPWTTRKNPRFADSSRMSQTMDVCIIASIMHAIIQTSTHRQTDWPQHTATHNFVTLATNEPQQRSRILISKMFSNI